MDYKYIEQLLERYWNAETTLEEENILRTFFCQKDIPAEMEPLRPLFTADANESLDDDFDARILAMIDEKPQTEKAQRVTLTQRLMPLFKAAAVVAIILTLGNAAQAPWDSTVALCPWDFPSKNTGVVCHFLHRIFPTQRLNHTSCIGRQILYH